MSILIKKPITGKLVKGRDHMLDYTMVWSHTGLPVNLSEDIETQYITIKRSDLIEDEEAELSLNSMDNPTQFITVSGPEGEGTYWIKPEDQDSIIPDKVKYCMDVVVLLKDGTQWPFVLDYSVVFSQPATQEI